MDDLTISILFVLELTMSFVLYYLLYTQNVRIMKLEKIIDDKKQKENEEVRVSENVSLPAFVVDKTKTDKEKSEWIEKNVDYYDRVSVARFAGLIKPSKKKANKEAKL